MKLHNILDSRLIACKQQAASKKAVLELISRLFSHYPPAQNTTQSMIFDAFVAREKLGSTALGHGVAIPHVRMDLYSKPLLAILQLQQAVDFESEDHRPVDIIFGLIAPENSNEDHLELLANCSSLLIQAPFRKLLRQAPTPTVIIELIESYSHHAEAI